MPTPEIDTDPNGAPINAGPLTPSKIVAVGEAPPESGTRPSSPPLTNTNNLATASTDPGVAPPPVQNDTLPSAPPVEGAPGQKNDSIDSLLDGITGPRGSNAKVAPTSGGAAAAHYKVTHGVKPGQDTPPPEPAVMVEPSALEMPKRSQIPTRKIDRSMIPKVAPVEEQQTTVEVPRKQQDRSWLWVVISVPLVLALVAVLIVRRYVMDDRSSAPPAPTAPAATSPATTEPAPTSDPSIPPPSPTVTATAPEPVATEAPRPVDKPRQPKAHDPKAHDPAHKPAPTATTTNNVPGLDAIRTTY